MSFVHGKDTIVYAHGFNLTPFLTAATAGGSADVADTSTFGGAAKTYIAGLLDGTLSLDGYMDCADNQQDEVAEAMLGAGKRIFSTYQGSDALGAAGRHLEADEVGYEATADVGSAVAFTAEMTASVGMERGVSLKPALPTFAATGDGSAQDGGAASTAGGAAYLHVLAKTGGTTINVVVQDSADGATGWATIATFTAFSVKGSAQRVAIAGTIRRYTRVSWTLGSGGTWSINVAITRKGV